MKGKKRYLVRNLLPRGKENAVSPERLRGLAGLDDLRALRKEIELERCDGAVILSDVHGGGYFREKNAKEIAEWVAGRECSINTTRRSMGAAQRMLKKLMGGEAND